MGHQGTAEDHLGSHAELGSFDSFVPPLPLPLLPLVFYFQEMSLISQSPCKQRRVFARFYLSSSHDHDGPYPLLPISLTQPCHAYFVL